jgi:predicted PurR-regulated permease PerM
MADSLKSFRTWITFAGCVLVVAVLHWAQAVFVPVALATLITFVLTPPVLWLQRYVGRLAAVFLVVTLVFSGLGLAGYGIAHQLSNLSNDLPTYRANIRAKIRDVRGAGRGGSVEKLQTTIKELQTDIGVPEPQRGTASKPVIVQPGEVAGVSAFSWLGPIVEPASTAGFVIVLVLFMLLERESLRDKLLGLIGHGHLAITTKAFDEAGRRVSRQLLLQTLVNVIYGALSATGLYFLSVPYPLFWGAAGAALRFIPYVGPLIAAGGPLVMALAALPGWTGPLEVAGYFVALELFTNLVLETVLYAGAAGVSQVALLVAVAFWTWLWGPLGLLMATPLTVCLVVLGKNVGGLSFLATLMSDVPALAPEYGYYQRLLARDLGEAADVIDRYVKAQPPETVYDAVMVPALNYAEQDRLDDNLDPDDEDAVVEATRELMADAPFVQATTPAPLEGEPAVPATVPPVQMPVLGFAVHSAADRVALDMLDRLLTNTTIRLEAAGPRLLASDLVRMVREHQYAAVCLSDLPPSSSSKTRYLVKRLRAAQPDLKILVGRWAPAALADASLQPVLDAGATAAASTLLDTRKQLLALVPAGGMTGSEHSHAA